MICPSRLRPAARIALVAPAGPLRDGALERACARVRALGWQPLPGTHAGGRSGYLSGSDEQRLADLRAALESRDNDAIWLLRGGYGTMRLLPQLDLSALAQRPRPLIGFSDNTALHLAAQKQGLITFHGPHPAAELPHFAQHLLMRLLTTAEPLGVLPFPQGKAYAEALVPGTAEGRLVGGNLSLVAATVGTPYQVDTRGAILFLEEVGEPLYRIDRLLTQLLLAGVFQGVAGIAIGAFSECPDEDDQRLPTAREIVLDRLRDLGVPIGYGFPFGHIPDTWTLPVGVRARLDTGAGTLELLESPIV